MRGSAPRAVVSLGRSPVRGLGLGLVLGLAAAAPASGAAPAPAESSAVAAVREGTPVARVEIDTRGIFDPLPEGRLRPLYRLADRLHVRTRSGTVREQLLIGAGDGWDPARARESERALRALDVFHDARVRARAAGDSAVLTVTTRDAWTTSPELSLERGGGRTFGSVRLVERNLLGRAQLVGASYRDEPQGISRSLEFVDPAVAGSRGRLTAAAGTGSAGSHASFALERPFHAEDARVAYGLRAERVRGEARLYAGGVQAATFYRGDDRVEVFAGRGGRRDGLVRRVRLSLLVWERRLGGSVLAPGAPADYAGGEEALHLRRLTLEGRLWRPRYVERLQVEQLDGVEDFDLGPSVTLAVGMSPGFLGGGGDEGHGAARLAAGVDAGALGFGWMRAAGSARLANELREGTLRADARWVHQSLGRHTLVLAALAAASHRGGRVHPIVIGGLNGLRAHDVHALSGDRAWRLNAESRWRLRRELLRLVSLGAAGFWDAARVRGPGSGDLPWQHDVGVGLRVGMPRSALGRVARFDVAWRVSPHGVRPGQAVFSFSSSQAF